MTKTIEIEIAAKSEWNAVLAVTMAAYNEYAAESDKEFWSLYEKSIERTILTDESIIRIVAKTDASILGTVLYCPPYEKEMGKAVVKNPFPEMRLLAVPPESRNRGTAGRLIRLLRRKGALRWISDDYIAHYSSDADSQTDV